jgi:hypothetical protein
MKQKNKQTFLFNLIYGDSEKMKLKKPTKYLFHVRTDFEMGLIQYAITLRNIKKKWRDILSTVYNVSIKQGSFVVVIVW